MVRLFFLLFFTIFFVNCANDSSASSKNEDDFRCYQDYDCRYGYYCNEHYICVEKITECYSNSDCNSGYRCSDNQCIPYETNYCYSNSDCGSNQKCVDGQCILNTTENIVYYSPTLGNKYVFAITPNNNSIAKIDINTLDIESLTVGINPTKIFTLPNKDIAVVLNKGSQELSIINSETNETSVMYLPLTANLNDMVLSNNGKYLIVYTNWQQEGSSDFGTGNPQEINLVNLETLKVFTLSVGYKPQNVMFNAVSSKAYVITLDGITIINLSEITSDRFLRTTPLSKDPLANGIGREVYITDNGNFALVREYNDKTVSLVDLTTEEIKSLQFDYKPTDIDIFDNGLKMLLTFKESKEVTVIDIPADFNTETFELQTVVFEGIDIMFSIIHNKTAFIYSPNSQTKSIEILNLDTLLYETILVRKDIISMAVTPNGEKTIIFHPVENGSNKAYYTLLDVESKFTKVIQTETIFKSFLFSSNSENLIIIFSGTNVKTGDIVNLNSFVVKDIEFGSNPNSIGIIEQNNKCYISQEHSEGRISFIDLLTYSMKTITGFELNSEIE